MKPIFTIAKFTAKDMLSRKSFRISTLIILLLIIVGCNIPAFLGTLGGGTFTDKILISDPANVYEGTLSSLAELSGTIDDNTIPDPISPLDYEFVIEPTDFDTIKTKIQNGEINSAIIVSETEAGANLEYVVKNTALTTTIPQDLFALLGTLYTNVQISKLNLTPAQLAILNTPLDINITQVDEQQIGGNIFAMMMLSIALFYAIYFCAFQVSSSITVEKTSKIIETLVTSTSPRNIIIGKTLGIGLVGLFQMLLIVGTAITSAYLFIDRAIIEALFDMSHFTIGLGFMSIVYFILGYLLYAFAYALTGSTVNKPEDVQSANVPVAIVAVCGFYLAYFTLTDPTSEINTLAALLPISSPFCMPIRMMMGLTTPLEIIASTLILLAAIALIANIAIKIYSNAILNYGTKLSLPELLKLYKAK